MAKSSATSSPWRPASATNVVEVVDRAEVRVDRVWPPSARTDRPRARRGRRGRASACCCGPCGTAGRSGGSAGGRPRRSPSSATPGRRAAAVLKVPLAHRAVGVDDARPRSAGTARTRRRTARPRGRPTAGSRAWQCVASSRSGWRSSSSLQVAVVGGRDACAHRAVGVAQEPGGALRCCSLTALGTLRRSSRRAPSSSSTSRSVCAGLVLLDQAVKPAGAVVGPADDLVAPRPHDGRRGTRRSSGR